MTFFITQTPAQDPAETDLGKYAHSVDISIGYVACSLRIPIVASEGLSYEEAIAVPQSRDRGPYDAKLLPKLDFALALPSQGFLSSSVRPLDIRL